MEKSVAYVQMIHLEPFMSGYDASSYEAHTNVRNFFYEVSVNDEKVPSDAPQVAQQALKRIFIEGENLIFFHDASVKIKKFHFYEFFIYSM